MATPLVSGCAALVREYYRKVQSHDPSAALLKATLVNGTRRLTGSCATADNPDLPNYHQGFGAVFMPFTLPNSTESWMGLRFVDTWLGHHQTFRFVPRGLDRVRFAFQVNGGNFLRICLAWTDTGTGANVQNILGLMLEGVGGVKIMGNEKRPSPVGRLDRDNNVQIIRLENPTTGNYLLQIFAANLLDSQNWALVVTGDLHGNLIEI